MASLGIALTMVRGPQTVLPEIEILSYKVEIKLSTKWRTNSWSLTIYLLGKEYHNEVSKLNLPNSNRSFADLLEIETDLLEIETALLEIETALPEMETALMENEFVSEYEFRFQAVQSRSVAGWSRSISGRAVSIFSRSVVISGRVISITSRSVKWLPKVT